MNKKGYLLSSEGNHYSFKVLVENNYVHAIKLFYSKVGNWTSQYKGKLRVSATMDENFNTTIKFDDGKLITLDVCQLAEVRHIAELMDSEGKNTFDEYTKVRNVK